MKVLFGLLIVEVIGRPQFKKFGIKDFHVGFEVLEQIIFIVEGEALCCDNLSLHAKASTSMVAYGQAVLQAQFVTSLTCFVVCFYPDLGRKHSHVASPARRLE